MLDFGSWSLPPASAESAYKTYEVRPLNAGESTYAGYTNTGVLTVTSDNEELLDRFYIMKITNESGTYTWTNAYSQFDQDGDSWRMPTKTEWPIFAGSFGIGSNYNSSTYSLSGDYWSSTPDYSNYAWRASFNDGSMRNYGKARTLDVRLCTTF